MNTTLIHSTFVGCATPEEAAAKVADMIAETASAPKFGKATIKIANQPNESTMRTASVLGLILGCVIDAKTVLVGDDIGFNDRVGTKEYANIRTTTHIVVKGEMGAVKLLVWIMSQPTALTEETLEALRAVLGELDHVAKMDEATRTARRCLIEKINEKFPVVRRQYEEERLRRILTPVE
jgi:hypothetical protein